MNTQELIRESQRWLDIISAPELTAEQKDKIQTDTVDNFNFYYNRGYLEYRKSVIEMREDPALEWAGEGSTFQDLSGRTYIDCLGGYGIYSAGIRHPKVVQAVADQLRRMPLSSQELLDPLRGALAELLGEITPGRPAVLLLHQQRHRRRRRRDQAGAGLHRQDQLHQLAARVPRQELRIAVAARPVGVPRALPAALARHPLRRVRRRRGRRGRALQGRPDRQGHRRRHHGADPGRSRRHRAARRLLAAHPQGLRRVRHAAHRRRGPDRPRPHGQALRRRPLESRARHHVPRQGDRRRRDAALGLHLDAQDLGRPREQPLHPLLDVRRQPARLRRRNRGDQRHAGGGPARTGGAQGQVHPRAAHPPQDALRPAHPARRRQGAAPRPRVRRTPRSATRWSRVSSGAASSSPGR